MIDDKSLSDQITEFHDYIRHMQTIGNVCNEECKILYLIDKLSLSWNEYVREFRYK